MEEYVRSDLKSSQGKVEVWAWIEKVRDQKSMQFVILKDRSGMLQMTIEKAVKPELAEIVSHFTQDYYVKVRGTVVPNEYVRSFCLSSYFTCGISVPMILRVWMRMESSMGTVNASSCTRLMPCSIFAR